MATEFGKKVLAVSQAPLRNPITIEGEPMDQWVQREQSARAQGATLLTNDDGTAYDPLFEGRPEEGNLFRTQVREQIASNYAWNKGHEDAILNGDPGSTATRANSYAQDPTVTDDLVEFLHSMYNNEHLDFGVLDGITGLEPDEQVSRVMQEVGRLNARKLNSKQQ